VEKIRSKRYIYNLRKAKEKSNWEPKVSWKEGNKKSTRLDYKKQRII